MQPVYPMMSPYLEGMIGVGMMDGSYFAQHEQPGSDMLYSPTPGLNRRGGGLAQQTYPHASGPVNTQSKGSFRVEEGLNLYVSQLPPSYNSTKLRDLFSRFGPIHSAKVMHHPKTNESRCFGFVLFERAEDGANAMDSMSGVMLEQGGNRLQIRVARATALPQPLREEDIPAPAPLSGDGDAAGAGFVDGLRSPPPQEGERSDEAPISKPSQQVRRNKRRNAPQQQFLAMPQMAMVPTDFSMMHPAAGMMMPIAMVGGTPCFPTMMAPSYFAPMPTPMGGAFAVPMMSPPMAGGVFLVPQGFAMPHGAVAAQPMFGFAGDGSAQESVESFVEHVVEEDDEE